MRKLPEFIGYFQPLGRLFLGIKLFYIVIWFLLNTRCKLLHEITGAVSQNGRNQYSWTNNNETIDNLSKPACTVGFYA